MRNGSVVRASRGMNLPPQCTSKTWTPWTFLTSVRQIGTSLSGTLRCLPRGHMVKRSRPARSSSAAANQGLCIQPCRHWRRKSSGTTQLSLPTHRDPPSYPPLSCPTMSGWHSPRINWRESETQGRSALLPVLLGRPARSIHSVLAPLVGGPRKFSRVLTCKLPRHIHPRSGLVGPCSRCCRPSGGQGRPGRECQRVISWSNNSPPTRCILRYHGVWIRSPPSLPQVKELLLLYYVMLHIISV